jgi:hypothetical protein
MSIRQFVEKGGSFLELEGTKIGFKSGKRWRCESAQARLHVPWRDPLSGGDSQEPVFPWVAW